MQTLSVAELTCCSAGLTLLQAASSHFVDNSSSHPALFPRPDELDNNNNLENAVLESRHTSTTESVLQWPHFDVFPSLRNDYISIFHLEQSRPRIRTKTSNLHPYITQEEVDSILGAFEHAVNFWYPTASSDQLKNARTIITNGNFDDEDGLHVCLAY